MQEINPKETKKSHRLPLTEIRAAQKALEQQTTDVFLKALSDARQKAIKALKIGVCLKLPKYPFGISIVLWRRPIR